MCPSYPIMHALYPPTMPLGSVHLSENMVTFKYYLKWLRLYPFPAGARYQSLSAFQLHFEELQKEKKSCFSKIFF